MINFEYYFYYKYYFIFIFLIICIYFIVINKCYNVYNLLKIKKQNLDLFFCSQSLTLMNKSKILYYKKFVIKPNGFYYDVIFYLC